MRIPKYVTEAMRRSSYEFGDMWKDNPNYAAGYTIRIPKYSPYSYAETLQSEILRLCIWADKMGGEGTAHILDMPRKTRHHSQAAVVTIFDPVMKYLEPFMPENQKEKGGVSTC